MPPGLCKPRAAGARVTLCRTERRARQVLVPDQPRSSCQSFGGSGDSQLKRRRSGIDARSMAVGYPPGANGRPESRHRRLAPSVCVLAFPSPMCWRAVCGTLAQQKPARGDGELRVFFDGQHDGRPDLKLFQWLMAGTARDAPATTVDILCVGQPQLRQHFPDRGPHVKGWLGCRHHDPHLRPAPEASESRIHAALPALLNRRYNKPRAISPWPRQPAAWASLVVRHRVMVRAHNDQACGVRRHAASGHSTTRGGCYVAA